jgi:hypothetical protein
VIELDGQTYGRLSGSEAGALSARIARAADDHPAAGSIRFAPYRVGSAFLVERA